jgi:LytR cell envelope-related transcriptional attenuator
VIGVAFLLIGGLVAVFAVIALNHPKGRQAARAATVPTNTSAATPLSASPKASASGSRVRTSTTPKPSTSSTAPIATASRPAVIVLNNTSDSALTNKAISRLTEDGWSATDGGSFSGDILSTAIYYDPNSSAAGQAAIALQAQFPQIKRVKEKFTGLPEGPLILVLTTDYS